jgi:hypothetical protein
MDFSPTIRIERRTTTGSKRRTEISEGFILDDEIHGTEPTIVHQD